MSFLNGSERSELAAKPPAILHRIRDERIRRGVGIDEVAAGLGRSSVIVSQEELPTSDLRLSTLRQWSRVLGVHVVELLIERPEYAGIPGLTTQRLKQIESTAQKIVSVTSDKATLTFAVGLCHQIREFFEEDIAPLSDPGAAM